MKQYSLFTDKPEEFIALVFSGQSLLSIISDILDFSKIEAGKMDLDPRDYELTSLVSDLVNLIWIRAEEKGLSLEVKVDPNIPHFLYGDEMRIKQIITNLLTNAVKYTEHGTVLLTVDHDKVSDSDITDKRRAQEALESGENVSRADGGVGHGLSIAQKLLRTIPRPHASPPPCWTCWTWRASI